MLRARDIMTEDVVAVSPELSIRDAVEMFVAQHLSGAPVVAGGEIVGVVSATDLLAAALAPSDGVPLPDSSLDDDPWDALLADLPAPGSDSDTSAAFFADVGVDAMAEDTMRAILGARATSSVLADGTVSDVMTRSPVVTVAPTAPVREVAEFMRERGIHRVLVTDGPKLLGIITTMDIARAVAEGRLATNTYVFNRDDRFDPRYWRPQRTVPRGSIRR